MALSSSIRAAAKIFRLTPTGTIPSWKTSLTRRRKKLRCWPAGHHPFGRTGLRNERAENAAKGRLLPVLVLNRLSTLHHKFHALERRHVLERVAIHRDHVRPCSRLQTSHLASPSQ